MQKPIVCPAELRQLSQLSPVRGALPASVAARTQRGGIVPLIWNRGYFRQHATRSGERLPLKLARCGAI